MNAPIMPLWLCFLSTAIVYGGSALAIILCWMYPIPMTVLIAAVYILVRFR